VDRRSWLPEDVRAHNRGLLLRLLTERGPLSRRELAHQTGLSIPTVTSIVTDLTDEGYVTESVPKTRSARRGPRATVVTLARNGYTVLGVDIRTDEVRVGLSDLSGLVTEATHVPFERGTPARKVLDLAVAAATPLVESAGHHLVGIGVGVPGPVDPERRKCVLSLILGWREIEVADAFERAFGAQTVVDYNVRAMAAAEARHGLGQRAENLLYVHVGEGVGFAFVVDGRPFRQGAHGVSELGHHQVVADGPRCVCGEVGCLEAVLCEPNLRGQVTRAAAESRVVADLLDRGLPAGDTADPEANHGDHGNHGRPRVDHGAAAEPPPRGPAPLDVLDAAARAGDPVAGRLLAVFTEHLSTAIALNVNVFSPMRVALGGILTQAPKEVIERVVAAARPKVFSVLRHRVTIEPSAIGAHAGLLGSATVALDHLFYDRGAVPAQPVRRPY
jgi:predicted NBD/HSP70 family sugar kinase